MLEWRWCSGWGVLECTVGKGCNKIVQHYSIYCDAGWIYTGWLYVAEQPCCVCSLLCSSAVQQHPPAAFAEHRAPPPDSWSRKTDAVSLTLSLGSLSPLAFQPSWLCKCKRRAKDDGHAWADGNCSSFYSALQRFNKTALFAHKVYDFWTADHIETYFIPSVLRYWRYCYIPRDQLTAAALTSFMLLLCKGSSWISLSHLWLSNLVLEHHNVTACFCDIWHSLIKWRVCVCPSFLLSLVWCTRRRSGRRSGTSCWSWPPVSPEYTTAPTAPTGKLWPSHNADTVNPLPTWSRSCFCSRSNHWAHSLSPKISLHFFSPLSLGFIITGSIG